ncbi:hypothetical protein [Ruegeria meonggei]|nr:hypothetical protein [Ruegeria meonggei]
MKMKGLLLRSMGSADETNSYYAHLAATYPDRKWISKAWWTYIDEEIQYASAVKVLTEALRRDPLNENLLSYYYGTCLWTGSECPPLFPERRTSYPELSCQDALELMGEHFDYLGDKLLEAGLRTVGELYEQEYERSKYGIQALHLGQTAALQGDPSNSAERFIVVNRVFDCIFPEKYICPLYIAQPGDDPEKRVQANIFTSELRRNLVDLAHVHLN